MSMSWFKRQKNKQQVGVSFTDMHVSTVALTPGLDGAKPTVSLATIQQVPLQAASTLRHFVTKNDLKTTPCNVMLNVDQYNVLQIEKPTMPESEIKQALRWKVKDLLDYSVEQAVVDGVNVPVDPAYANRQPAMLAICAKKATVTQIGNQIVEAGFNLKSIDVHALVQRNIAKLLETEDRALVMLTMLNRGCLLTFTAKGELYHARLIELDKDFLNDRGELYQSNFDKLVLELQRSLDSFDRQFPYLSLNRLVVAPVANRDYLVTGLSTSLYVPVNVFNLEDIVDLPPNQDFASLEKQAMLLPALGAALRQETVA
jgi:MSHA biogenesis protein MshI